MLDSQYDVVGHDLMGEDGFSVKKRIITERRVLPHTHTFYELTLYRNYKGMITLNGVEFNVDGAFAVLLPPSDNHSMLIENEESESIQILFTKIFMAQSADKYFPRTTLYFTDPLSRPLLIELLEEVNKIGKANHYSGCLIASIVQYFRIYGNTVIKNISIKSHEIVVSAMNFINENFTEEIYLTTVAKHLNVSPQYLSSVFVDECKINFVDYLSKIRLRYAAEQLKNTKLSVTEICYTSGYRNISNFMRSFKRTFGLTPRAYRINSQTNKK